MSAQQPDFNRKVEILPHLVCGQNRQFEALGEGEARPIPKRKAEVPRLSAKGACALCLILVVRSDLETVESKCGPDNVQTRAAFDELGDDFGKVHRGHQRVSEERFGPLRSGLVVDVGQDDGAVEHDPSQDGPPRLRAGGRL
jgi:hypothetical protein